MGCEVSQTSLTTTVKGPAPGGLKGVEVDMEHLTDAFMTAAAVAAVANGTTRVRVIPHEHTFCSTFNSLLLNFLILVLFLFDLIGFLDLQY